ncbi:gfo/Idh/MocA family oxidoreductase [Nocardioides marmorisolisilvae]|uniref:Gfo/Idh/MocA family oxidoreductase n=2 Tax=Nocardioides marmorisolisilvae TaxID=1542737 RepID=A0A3N0DXM3_9ACTN|nr:gfo/Idh/MocA family oxidoreductase [Nocardioides marmorisolisilvae]
MWGRDSDYEARFAEVDAVAFAVPPSVQAEIALRAARAGKHLLLEKPIALDLAAADALVAEVDARDLSSVVFFTQRFVPPWEEWLSEVAASAPLGGRADWLSAQAGSDSPYAGSVWRQQHGALWDVGPHQLAQLITALGPVAEVTGTRGAGDLVHLVLTHDSGATSRMSLSLTMPPGTTRITVEFYGADGWLQQPEHTRDVHDAYSRAVSELVANIRSGETRHRVDVRFGRQVVEVLTRAQVALDPRR